MEEWHAWLVQICDNLLLSAEGNPNLEFWDKIASHHGGGSGPSYISGWISAFAVFTAKGEWQGNTSLKGKKMPFPVIETGDIPSGVTSVPVLVDDNGAQYDCFMLAGHVGYTVNTSGDGIIPRTDWCIATATPVPSQ